MGFNGIIWWRKKPQKKTKKSKPKKVKVFWHKDPISIDSSERSSKLDTSLTDAAFKLCSLKDPPSTYKRASTSTTFGTSSTTLDNSPISPADSSCIYCGVHYNTELSLLSHVRSSVLNFDVDINGLGEGQHIRPRSDVLHAIDTFCISRHWMVRCILSIVCLDVGGLLHVRGFEYCLCCLLVVGGVRVIFQDCLIGFRVV